MLYTMERSYSGMNSAYYVGMESAFYCPPERFESSDLKEFLAGNASRNFAHAVTVEHGSNATCGDARCQGW